MTTKRKPRPITGKFGKAIDGSVSINFGVSGGANCDDGCQLKNNGCYAQRVEIRPDRTQLAAKLRRHQNMPAWQICGRALAEIQALVFKGKRVPWVRISTAGSLPQPADVRGDGLFRAHFRALLAFCRDNAIPVHIPVETYAKARFYRALGGDLVTIRESAQTYNRFERAKGAVSIVAGEREHSMLERIETARAIAKARTAHSGRKAIVCPAVATSFRAKLKVSPKNDKAKCGNCTACAEASTDIVYPLH